MSALRPPRFLGFRGAAVAGLTLAALTVTPVPAGAQATCSFVSGTLSVTLTAGDEVTVVRAGGDIVVSEGLTPLDCGSPGPTVSTTGLIDVRDSSGSSSTELVIDLSGGPFEPGADDEPGSSDEIEWNADLGVGIADVLTVVGEEVADHIAFGTDGISGAHQANLNAEESSDDVDVVVIGVEIHRVEAGGGADDVAGDGSDGTGSDFGGRLTLDGGPAGDELIGGAVGDVLRGDDGADTLTGGSGRDQLQGGLAIDVLTGGEGNDLLVGGASGDTESGDEGDDAFDQEADPNGGDDIAGGGGALDVVAYDQRDGNVVVTLNDLAGDGESGEGDDVGSDVEGVLTGSGNDDVTGASADNFFGGGPGVDDLDGAGGNDQVTGGPGNDHLDGGGSVDTADFFHAPGPVSVDLDAGTAAGDGDDDLVSIESAGGGAFDDQLVGDGGPNELRGAGGRDLLQGAAGDDLLLGGPSEDELDGGADPDGIDGGQGDDTLLGGPGNDGLDGGQEDDLLEGGPEDDEVRGGNGSDTATFRNAPGAVTVDLEAQTAAGDGTDTLPGIEDADGGPFGDDITGDAGVNVLTGRGGADAIGGRGGQDIVVGGPGNDDLDGGAGGDTFEEGKRRNGADSISGGSGPDLADYGKRSGNVRASLDGRPNDGEANERDDLGGIENVQTGDGNDRIEAQAGANHLAGGKGDDRIEGGQGDDVLKGEAGDDHLDGGPGEDRCIGGSGRDEVVGCER